MFKDSCISPKAESKSFISWENLNTFWFLINYLFSVAISDSGPFAG